MSNDYISRADARTAFLRFFSHDEDQERGRFNWHNFKVILSTIPAADVRAVPKGQWVIFDAESEKCSYCKRRYYISALFAVGGNTEPDFCPGCGAYMGGDACAE